MSKAALGFLALAVAFPSPAESAGERSPHPVAHSRAIALASQEGERRQGRPEGRPQEPQPPQALNESQTRGRIDQFQKAKHWAMRGLVLLSLGPEYHPAAAEILATALGAKEQEMRAYALETLHRTDPAALRRIASNAIIETLIEQHSESKDENWRGLAQDVLERIFPDATAKNRNAWRSHWRSLGKNYIPEDWVPPPAIEGSGTTAGGAVERAMDLYEAGLEVCICIDSTGSMQPVIDACAAAVKDLVAMLSSLSPEFRIGLVHYKDVDDMHYGADVLNPLDEKADRTQRNLSQLLASGGGDFPEAVERGLSVALDQKRMGWKRGTNKLIVVIGDAPPHDRNVQEAVNIAREAFQRPFGVTPTPVEATPRDRKTRTEAVRPFVVSTIGVGTNGIAQPTAVAFRQIAEAGGGAFAMMTLEGNENPGETIVARILELSFGAQYREQIQTFVEIYLRWQRRGVFR